MSSSYLPRKRHLYKNHFLDSSRWDHYAPRAGDIVISTSYKSGTTWTQGIVRELIVSALSAKEREDPRNVPLPDNGSCIWPDARWLGDVSEVFATLENQTHRRSLKTHLPLDGLPYFPQVKYIVVGRDARDVFMSLWNHFSSTTNDFWEHLSEVTGIRGSDIPRCPENIHDFWRGWINRGWFEWEEEGYPYWGNLHHTRTWWEYRQLENIEFIHYADLLTNPKTEVMRIANFIGDPVSNESASLIVEKTCLQAMRERRKSRDEAEGRPIRGAATFFFKGTNGRWRDVLAEDELQMYEEKKSRLLKPDCARWLENGGAAWPSS